MHATIRRYEGIDKARTEELTTKVDETFLPRMSKLDGFRGYYLIETNDGVMSSISFFDTMAQADESTRLSATWVRDEKLDTILPNPPKVTGGEGDREQGCREGARPRVRTARTCTWRGPACGPSLRSGPDRLAEGVRRGLQPVADLGQLSRREVDALLLDLRALLLFVGPLPLAVGALASAFSWAAMLSTVRVSSASCPAMISVSSSMAASQSYAGGSVSNGSDSRIQMVPSAVSTAGEPSPGSVRSVRVTFTRLPSSSANGPCTGPIPNA